MNWTYIKDFFYARSIDKSNKYIFNPPYLVRANVEDNRSHYINLTVIIGAIEKKIRVEETSNQQKVRVGYSIRLELLPNSANIVDTYLDQYGKYPIFGEFIRNMQSNFSSEINRRRQEFTIQSAGNCMSPEYHRADENMNYWCGDWELLYDQRSFDYKGKLVEIILDGSYSKISEYSMQKAAVDMCDTAFLLLPEITAQHASAAVTLSEVKSFCESARYYNALMDIYESFAPAIDRIYAENFRYFADGSPDRSKVESILKKFVRREAIPARDPLDEESLPEDLAMIAFHAPKALHLGATADGKEFEKEIAASLVRIGFIVSETATSGDFGGDIIAEKYDLRIAIQCKSHARPVGIKAVQEAVGARRYYKCDYSAVVAPFGFTAAAHELARETDVHLILASSVGRIEEIVFRN